jgi:hypothetical protein
MAPRILTRRLAMACYLAAATLVNLKNTWEQCRKEVRGSVISGGHSIWHQELAPDRSSQGKRGKVVSAITPSLFPRDTDYGSINACHKVIFQSIPDRNGGKFKIIYNSIFLNTRIAKTKPADGLQPFCDPYCKAYDTGVERCRPSHATSGDWARIVIPCD